MAQGYIGQNQVNMDSSGDQEEIKVGDTVVWKSDKSPEPIRWTVIELAQENMGEKRILVREYGKKLPDWETWAKWFKKL